jgi:hypothetical protein
VLSYVTRANLGQVLQCCSSQLAAASASADMRSSTVVVYVVQLLCSVHSHGTRAKPWPQQRRCSVSSVFRWLQLCELGCAVTEKSAQVVNGLASVL